MTSANALITNAVLLGEALLPCIVAIKAGTQEESGASAELRLAPELMCPVLRPVRMAPAPALLRIDLSRNRPGWKLVGDLPAVLSRPPSDLPSLPGESRTAPP